MIRALALCGLVAFAFIVRPAMADIAFQRGDGNLSITVDGKPFAVYVWNDPTTTRPYFKQVHALGGEVQITRNHPPAANDIGDHATFHPGIWWGFGDVGGNDYWRLKARVVGGNFVDEPRGGQDRGEFSVRDKLLVNGGDETFCEQLCRYTILKRPHGILLVCETSIQREQGDFWLGDQEEMGLAVRVATPLAMASGKGGAIKNSEHGTDLKKIRTQQSDWCDYSGPIAGRHGGLLVMNNPGNFRKPWWHAVDTGLLVANPLGESELNGRGKRKENVFVKSGQSFRLSYGVLVHLDDNAATFDPTKAYADFLKVLPTLNEKKVTMSELPQVPSGFKISVFAKEPLVYKPTSMCFDAKGRLFVGQGPQYPENYANSPTDSVVVFIDSDGDGEAETMKEFAKGFNSVQGLAWRGNDLYVANSPELTVVRDSDGDDVADEYVMLYTDLGNREHALHGLNWGPDGKLYMSKGNSKGHNQPEKTGYVAPKPFRDLWDVEHPPGAPDWYPPQAFTKDNYRKTYHHWDDDWGREGGVLRCDPDGKNLEIVARGLRNPWDITLDAGFNWLGTDNDQSQGDRLVMPFFGAHFGWGHPYSSHWSGEDNLPTVPVSGPMFPGSGAGIIYYDHEHFPPEYRQVFIINDWLNGTFVYRPAWQGALMQPNGGALAPFIRRGNGNVLYRPTDLEFGPDGALYISGWGGNYDYSRDAEGSWIFRVSYVSADALTPWKLDEKRMRPHSEWKFEQLLDDLGPGALSIWRISAQDELVLRGADVRDALLDAIDSGKLSTGQQTWAVWALGRMLPRDATIEKFLIRSASQSQRFSQNLRLQAMRILAFRALAYRERDSQVAQVLPDVVREALVDADPRVRFEAVQAIYQAEDKLFTTALLDRLADEQDRLVFFAGWGALRKLATVQERKRLLADARPRVRLASLLSLQEEFQLTLDEALELAEKESDSEVQSWALAFAMNPRPPSKMPNTTARVELEQSIPAQQLIERARQEVDRPDLRLLYLKLISRGSFRGGDLKAIGSFYETLHGDDEKALVIVPLATSVDARELVWDAFQGKDVLQRAAVEGWHRMAQRSARALPADESRIRVELGQIREESPLTNIEANAVLLASWLLEKMSASKPRDTRMNSAVEVLADSKLPLGWKPPTCADSVLATLLDQQTDTLVRLRVLSILEKIDPEHLAKSELVRGAVGRLCLKPDPRLYLALKSITKRLGMGIEIPILEAATKEGVLQRLVSADAARGRHLFFEKVTGAGCAACHRVAGQGNDFAPDLSSIGLRSKPESIVEALLSPSAAITEGYHQQILVTDEGRTIVGVVLRETASELTVFQTDQTKTTLAARSILERKKSTQSAMPDGYGLFGNEQIADLTAYLLTLKHNSPQAILSQSPAE